MTTKKINKGFTLIEVLLVMVLIGVLLSIGLVSLNTEDRLIETRNNTRQTHIQTLESAITQYKLQEGNYPTGLNRNYQEICDPEATVCTGFFDIKPFLVPTYIQAIPQDPNDDNTTGGIGYSVAVDEITNTVSVRALQAEGGETISINDPLPAEPTVTANTQLAATVPNLPPTSTPTVYAIGDTGPGGGKVFYVAGNTYLEAAPSNWSGGTDPGLTWSTGGNQTTVVSGADNSAIGGGFQNTVDIVNQAGNVTASSAAVRARNYTGGGMTDWFLPSKDELAALYAQRTTTGIPTGVVYWSSSELSSTNAWLLWDNGVFVTNAGKDWTGRVRPIRMGVIQTTPTVTATGGNITTINQNGIWYKVHTFLTNGTFTVTNGGNVEYLVVAGGGGGGNGRGGGGGAGGMKTGSNLAVTAQTYPVTIGAGGAAQSQGGESSVFGISTTGGGRGGSHLNTDNGGAGGSGGGAAMNYSNNYWTGGSGVSGEGSNGGNAGTTQDNPRNTGGGGGKSAAGTQGQGTTQRPNGGAGAEWPVGSGNYYAGGGGGSRGGTDMSSAGAGTGGIGGGGTGGGDLTRTNGTANTGGGGGGSENTGASGGSGIVIVRYPTPAPTIVQNGLVLHLDAGNTSSYPGTGTTWTDLSGNGNNFTLFNSSYYSFSSVNGGSIGFTRTMPPAGETGGYAEHTGSGALAVGTYLYNNHTTEIWARINDRNPTAYDGTETISALFVYRGYHAMFYYTASSLRYNIWNGTSNNTNPPNLTLGTSGTDIIQGQWFHAVAVRSGNNVSSYINGNLKGTNVIDTSGGSGGTSSTIRMGMASLSNEGYSWHANSNVSTARMYNRALTAEEIQQNFNATKDRYGL